MSSTMHFSRKTMQNECPVCGAKPFGYCHTVSADQVGKVDPRDQEPGEAEWLEFAILRECHALKEVAPEHWLVQAIEAACATQTPHDNPGQGKLFP